MNKRIGWKVCAPMVLVILVASLISPAVSSANTIWGKRIVRKREAHIIIVLPHQLGGAFMEAAPLSSPLGPPLTIETLLLTLCMSQAVPTERSSEDE